MPCYTSAWHDTTAISAFAELALSFDAEFVATGHGDVGNMKDLVHSKTYLQALKVGVVTDIADEQSVDEIKKPLLLQDYSDWGRHDAWGPTDIERKYAYLRRGTMQSVE